VKLLKNKWYIQIDVAVYFKFSQDCLCCTKYTSNNYYFWEGVAVMWCDMWTKQMDTVDKEWWKGPRERICGRHWKGRKE